MKECVKGLSPEKAKAFEEFMRLCRQTAVYRYYDDEIALMYVGISTDFEARDREHIRASPWRVDALFAQVYQYEDRETAMEVEAWAHHDDRPPCCRKFERRLGPRESLPEPPDHEWFYVGGRTPVKMDAAPEIDSDGILNFLIEGKHLCIVD